MVGSIFYVLQNFWRFIGGGMSYDLLYLYHKIPDIDKTDSFWKWQEKPNQYSDQIVRWQQNSFETLQEFWSEFWWPALVSNHSNDFWVLGRIRWPRNSCEILQGFDQNSFQELDDHGILTKFFKDFYQNSGGQP